MSDVQALLERLAAIEDEALEAVEEAPDAEALEAVRIEFLGRKEGRISGILRSLGDLDPEARPRVGSAANRLKEELTEALGRREAELTRRDPYEEGPADPTLPGRPGWIGARHPVQQVIDDICAIFARLGFARARGPEAETEWYNFEALNTPLDHPAADEQDTLYLAPGILLRSHTSPVQIRTMERHDPPIRILAPGMVYRRDTPDATHTPAFLQIEGLAVDEGISFVDFKATLSEFARFFWGAGTRVRFRPSFFPFTEPSAEVDVMRGGSKGKGEWLEIMGAGMVDPAVLEHAGYDAERYTGFAFGMGPARIAALRYGVPDLRTFFENDIRVLEQFS